MDEKELTQTKEQIRNEELKKVAQNLVKASQSIYQAIIEAFETILGYVREALGRAEEKRKRVIHYKLDFSRPIIKHQVIDRRPRLIKKVIR